VGALAVPGTVARGSWGGWPGPSRWGTGRGVRWGAYGARRSPGGAWRDGPVHPRSDDGPVLAGFAGGDRAIERSGW